MLTDLIVVQVVETLEGEVLLLDLLDHFLGELPELAQRGHRLPPTGGTTNVGEESHSNEHWIGIKVQ